MSILIEFYRKYESNIIFSNFIFSTRITHLALHGINMKFFTQTLGILIEGSMSQILYLGLSLYFMIKNVLLFIDFSRLFTFYF